MPIYFPQNSIEDASEFTEPRQPSRTQSFLESMTSGVLGSPLNSAYTHLTQHFGTGQTLTPEQYKSSDYYRPGINVDSPINESYAKVLAQNYDTHKRIQLSLAQANGFTRKASEFAGGIAAMAMDPVTIGLSFVAPELAGAKIGSVVDALANAPKAARIGGQAAMGAIEGAAIATPTALSQKDVLNQIGIDESSLDVLENIGVGAAFGGVIRSFSGYKSIKDEQEKIQFQKAHQDAMQTAIKQILSGKSVQVDSVIHEGIFNKESKGYLKGNNYNQEPVSLPNEKMQIMDETGLTSRTNLTDFIARTDKQIKQKTNQLANEESLEESNRVLNGLKTESIIPETLEGNFDAIAEILHKPGFQRSAEENILLKDIPKTEEYKKIIQALEKPAFDRDLDENFLLRKVAKGDEKGFVEARLGKYKQDAEILENEINKTLPKRSPRKLKRLKLKHAELQKNIEDASNRLNEIKHGKDKLSVSQGLKNDIQNLHFLNRQAKRLKEILDLEDAIKNINPPDYKLIESKGEKLRSFKGDSTFNERDYQKANDDMARKDKTDDELIDDLKSEIENSGLDDELKEELQVDMEDIKNEERKMAPLKKALTNLINCIKK